MSHDASQNQRDERNLRKTVGENTTLDQLLFLSDHDGKMMTILSMGERLGRIDLTQGMWNHIGYSNHRGGFVSRPQAAQSRNLCGQHGPLLAELSLNSRKSISIVESVCTDPVDGAGQWPG
jgi:hypothetical protein